MLREIRHDIRAVSEVVGSVLLLLMTVTVFSGIIIFVDSIQGPGNQTFVDLVPAIDRTDANNGIVIITHAGGQPLDASTTEIVVLVNSTRYQLAVADGLVPVGGKWNTGQRWMVPFGSNTLSQNATVQVTVIDLNVNQIVLLALVQRGIGTGGTFTGVARFMKERLPKVHCVAVETQGSVLQGGAPGPHKVEGIGSSFVPETFDRSVCDEIIMVYDKDAFDTVAQLARQEGVLGGSSAGANVFAAIQVAKKLGSGKRVVTIIPDSAERYMSKNIFAGGI